MMKAKTQLIKSTIRAFGTQNTLAGAHNPDRNHSLRVMSTPTWPVPYYQRIMKHPVNSGDIDKGTLSYVVQPVDDVHAMLAKERLKADGLGYVVEAIENHADTKTYCTSFNNSGAFCKAYMEDLLDCLSVGFDQNKRALNDIDLADALK